MLTGDLLYMTSSTFLALPALEVYRNVEIRSLCPRFVVRHRTERTWSYTWSSSTFMCKTEANEFKCVQVISEFQFEMK
uniref:Secreted protein n=1 Tax=Steinernema glaseri TaxID=37863 RepID=A0A1I7YGH8_9BILA